MPSVQIVHLPDCKLAHWRKGERWRYFWSTVRCSGRPPRDIHITIPPPDPKLLDEMVADVQAIISARTNDVACELAAERFEHEASVTRLTGIIEEYANHTDWRCGHPDRYEWTPDCPCGLTRVCRELDIETTD